MMASYELKSSHIPVLLLKTISTPSDAYQELFTGQASSANPPNSYHFVPEFVPVLQHTFDNDGVYTLTGYIQTGQIGPASDSRFGGMVFTSQRAVEAFSHALNKISQERPTQIPDFSKIPFYSVGPATTRALGGIPSLGSAFSIYGSETGNGDALAKFILSHYRANYYPDRATLPALLFCVGEVRRDIIPKTLMSSSLPQDQRIEVSELVVYGTDEMLGFREALRGRISEYRLKGVERAWAVVFSPTGCSGLLQELGYMNNNEHEQPHSTDQVSFRIATIGPTTRQHLIDNFGFKPAATADKPTPHGVLNAIVDYMRSADF